MFTDELIKHAKQSSSKTLKNEAIEISIQIQLGKFPHLVKLIFFQDFRRKTFNQTPKFIREGRQHRY